MDYPCEPEFDNLFSVEDRISMSVENAISQTNLDPSYDLIPVLQGRLLHQYIDCYDRLVDHGIDCSRVGIGTLCRVASSPKICWLEERLRAETGIEWIHAFGTKIDAIKLGATFDSSAWIQPLNFGLTYTRSENHLEKVRLDNTPRERTLQSFKAYYTHVNDVIDSYAPGKLLRL